MSPCGWSEKARRTTRMPVMDAEPSKFFIGVIDLFAVVLPGATLAFAVAVHPIAPNLIPIANGPTVRGEPAMWALFLVASYILGHFVFLFGSSLDNWLYAPLRQATKGNREATKGDVALARPMREKLARHLFGEH